MQTATASPVRLDKERIDHLVRVVRELLRRYIQDADELGMDEKLAADVALGELWDRLSFLTPADVTKLVVRDILTPRRAPR